MVRGGARRELFEDGSLKVLYDNDNGDVETFLAADFTQLINAPEPPPRP